MDEKGLSQRMIEEYDVRLARVERAIWGLDGTDGILTELRIIRTEVEGLREIMNERLNQRLSVREVLTLLVIPIFISIAITIVNYFMLGGK